MFAVFVSILIFIFSIVVLLLRHREHMALTDLLKEMVSVLPQGYDGDDDDDDDDGGDEDEVEPEEVQGGGISATMLSRIPLRYIVTVPSSEEEETPPRVIIRWARDKN